MDRNQVSGVPNSSVKKSILGRSNSMENRRSSAQPGQNFRQNMIFDYGDDDTVVESSLWSNIKFLFRDFFPDNTPINFTLIQMLTVFVFLCFSPLSFPEFDKESGPIHEDGPGILRNFVFISVCLITIIFIYVFKGYSNPDESQSQLIFNTVLYLLSMLILNYITLVFILLSRFIILRCVTEPLYHISRHAVIITYSLDPYIFYCIWSILNYSLFLRFIKPSTLDDIYIVYKLFAFGDYYSHLFWIDDRCYIYSNSLYYLHILLCVRKLILSTLLFIFELQFLTNYTTDLKLYLSEVSILKKFNNAWYQYVDGVRRDVNDNNKMNQIVIKYLMADMPANINKSYNTKLFLYTKDDFKIFRHVFIIYKILIYYYRPIITKWNHHKTHHNINLNNDNMIDFIKDKWIKMSSNNLIINWILLNFVIHNPPTLLLLNCSIELLHRNTVDVCSNLLFNQIHDTLSIYDDDNQQNISNDNTNTSPPPEVQSTSFRPADSSSDYLSLKSKTTPGDREVKFSPPEVTTSRSPAESSSNYLSLKGNATPGDRGEDEGDVEGSDGARVSTGPRVEPVADLREAKGEVNKKGHHGEWKTSNGPDLNNVTSDIEHESDIGGDLSSELLKLQSKVSEMPLIMRYKSTIHPKMSSKKCLSILKRSVNVTFDEIDDNRFITKKMCQFINPTIVDDFFSSYDYANCGSISSSNFIRNITYMCSIRKRLITRLKNQRSILNLVGNLLSITLWFFTLVVFTLSLRINRNIVLPSTIGLFSATIVALSYMYTSFITAIIFVVISNPYNVGDRVRISGGEAIYVSKITTYTTEFTCIHGKRVIYQNGLLSKLTITNETRANNATHEIVLNVAPNITPAALKLLKENIRTYINDRPRDFIKNGCYFYGKEIQINHYYQIIIWITCVESWVNPIVVFKLRSDLLHLIAKQCKLLGITYKEPLQALIFNNNINLGMMNIYLFHIL